MAKLTREEKAKINMEQVDMVIENNELTDREQVFCLEYIRCFNATKAHQRAYKSSYNVANAEGYKLLVKPCIKAEIGKLKRHKLNRNLLSENDIFQKFIDIAFADLTDYIEFGKREVETESGTKVVSYVDLKESTEVDGSVISEVTQGRDGVKIKLHDKMKALQWLADRLDLITAVDQERLRIAQERLDHDRNSDEVKSLEINIVSKEER